MRTRSDAARQRSLLKLPEDCIRNVALFIDCDVDAARLALTSRRVMRSMTPTVWAQILKASHGGLKIAAADLDDGLRVAARLAAARLDASLREQAVRVLDQRCEYDLHIAALRAETPRERPAQAGLVFD